eukprot:TRINITY_DN626_c0_g1_i2.p1 TRINITY_DN626_c0_g1~~TRINITY_DN626_c0_g1_i2.p1  ORF type:complete len:812 (-),score=35.03 TRINITY_DN626_c0_g1_i2:3904-6339(-)
MVIYGGATGGGGLANEDLHLLDLRKGNENISWIVIKVSGANPGKRYGHSLSFCKPYLVLFGGHSEAEPQNDVWVLSIERAPFQWERLDTKGPMPEPRAYHTAAICTLGIATGMIVVFGGRGIDHDPRNDTWGLRRHRNGTWEWVRAPYKAGKPPAARYQHCAVFTNTLMLVVGGRSNTIGESLGIVSYDTETLGWGSVAGFPCFRHSCWVYGSSLYSFGGFSHSAPNNPHAEFLKMDLSKTLKYSLEIFQATDFEKLPDKPSPKFIQAPSEKAFDTNDFFPKAEPKKDEPSTPSSDAKHSGKGQLLPPLPPIPLPNVRFHLSPNAVVGMSYSADIPTELQKVVRSFTIDRLPEESRKLSPTHRSIAAPPVPFAAKTDVVVPFLNQLLKPKEWLVPPAERKFMFKAEKIVELARECQKVLEAQPIVVQVKSPVKIFGDIHGQYHDLMRFFDLWRGPTEASNGGDIDSYDYLFLGDYVDRGSHSLETICLLMALKVKYPNQVHLLRGNHEDKWINIAFGFAEECAERLLEDVNNLNSVFQAINTVFEYLPLAALIDNKIICLHGGIGSSVNTIDDIRRLRRPLEVVHEVTTLEHQIVVDILWSDPTDNDEELGVHLNAIRDPTATGSITRFGPDRVEQFLKKNNLKMIIRGHECVMDGFERFAKGSLATIFSATDYCGRYKNAGAILVVQKNYEILPKLIFPTEIGGEQSNWIQDEKRPPTPPRQSIIIIIQPQISSYTTVLFVMDLSLHAEYASYFAMAILRQVVASFEPHLCRQFTTAGIRINPYLHFLIHELAYRQIGLLQGINRRIFLV